MYETFEDENYFYLVLEYCSKGNLYLLLKEQGVFSEEKAFKYFNQILQAIQFMHKRQIIHRDLKLANILLTQDDNIKICDFNWATELNDGQADPVLCGTVDQMPPEVSSFSFHDTNKINKFLNLFNYFKFQSYLNLIVQNWIFGVQEFFYMKCYIIVFQQYLLQLNYHLEDMSVKKQQNQQKIQ